MYQEFGGAPNEDLDIHVCKRRQGGLVDAARSLSPKTMNANLLPTTSRLSLDCNCGVTVRALVSDVSDLPTQNPMTNDTYEYVNWLTLHYLVDYSSSIFALSMTRIQGTSIA